MFGITFPSTLYFPFVESFTPSLRMKITLYHVVDGMPCLLRHCTRPGGLTPSQWWFTVFTASGRTIALSQGSSYLDRVCQCASLPPVLLSPPKQKGWLITPSCCVPIKYYYSCFVCIKKRTGEKLWRLPGNVCGFVTSVKDLCPWLVCYCLKTSLQQLGNTTASLKTEKAYEYMQHIVA